MAYGVFDKEYEATLISGVFTSEKAANDFRMTYVDDDGFQFLFVEKICDKHETDQSDQDCDCWYDMPYDDERGSLL